jgi:hypothetical protein
MTTKWDLPLQGIAVDGLMAVEEQTVRLLDPAELPSNIQGAGIPVQIGGDISFVSSSEKARELEDHYAAIESTLGPRAGANSPWTEGSKTDLYIRVTFSDTPATEPLSLAAAQSFMASVSTFYLQNSYNKASVTPTFTPTLVLDQTAAYYGANSWTVLLDEAVAKAAAAGYPETNYDFCTIATPRISGFSWAGRAFIGGNRCHLNGDFALRVAAHEIGHNFGLYHSNYNYTPAENPPSLEAYAGYDPADTTPLQQYGHKFSMMGATGTDQRYHFPARDKRLLDWLTDTEVQTITQSGTYRIFRNDDPAAVGLQSIRVASGDSAQPWFWLAHRRQFTSNASFSNGAEVIWGKTGNFSDGTVLVDTTPYSHDGPHDDSYFGDDSDKNDAALTPGRMFGSADSGAWFTVIGQGGSAPNEYIDVSVNIGNSFTNQPPGVTLQASATTVALNQSVTFTATASDPDGDTIAYGWDLDDSSLAANSASVSKSWNVSGWYVVRCIASDGKGGIATAFALIKVGTPTTFTISGQVLSKGQPVDGVRVSNDLTGSSYLGSYTNSSGQFIIPRVPAGSHTLSAKKTGYVFAPANFTNPVAVTAAAVTGLAFSATTSPNPTITMDNADAQGITITATSGSWSALNSTTGFYATNFLSDNNSGKGQKSVRYTPTLPTVGYYRVLMRYPSASTRADNVPVDIQYRGGTVTVSVNQQINGNTWNDLGTYDFNAGSAGSVLIRNTATNGSVAADAIRFELVQAQDAVLGVATAASAAESGVAPGAATFTRSGSVTLPLTAYYSVSGSAASGVDYSALPGTITFAAGQTSADVTVQPLADSLPEGAETVVLTLQQAPAPLQDWAFNDSNGTLLNAAANTGTGTAAWDAAIGNSSVQSGKFRIQRPTSGNGSAWADIPDVSTGMVWVVVDISGWNFTGTANEALRIGLTDGANTTNTAILLVTHSASGIELSGEAGGTGAASITPVVISANSVSSSRVTLLLKVDFTTRNYTVSRSIDFAPFVEVGNAAFASSRSGKFLRFTVQNSFNDAAFEFFDIDRIQLANADPTQAFYSVNPPGVAVVSIADHPQDDWRWRKFTPDQLTHSEISGWFVDPDGDGFVNLFEHAFNLNPVLRDGAGLPQTQTVVAEDGKRYLAVTFPRRAVGNDLAYLVEATGNLTSAPWPDTAVQFGTPLPVDADGYEQVTFRDTVPYENAPQRFLRVNVHQQ